MTQRLENLPSSIFHVEKFLGGKEKNFLERAVEPEKSIVPYDFNIATSTDPLYKSNLYIPLKKNEF